MPRSPAGSPAARTAGGPAWGAGGWGPALPPGGGPLEERDQIRALLGRQRTVPEDGRHRRRRNRRQPRSQALLAAELVEGPGEIRPQLTASKRTHSRDRVAR